MRYLSKPLMSIALAMAVAVAAPATAANTPREQTNKQAVIDFYSAIRQAEAAGTIKQSIQGIAEKYLDPGYIQHAEGFRNLPGPGSDRDKLIRAFQGNAERQPGPAPAGPPEQVITMAEGDLVMMLRSRDRTDPATGTVRTVAVFNMFRMKNGKLAEHWDVMPASAGPPAGSAPPPR